MDKNSAMEGELELDDLFYSKLFDNVFQILTL